MPTTARTKPPTRIVRSIALPTALYARLKAKAKSTKRSVNWIVVEALKADASK